MNQNIHEKTMAAMDNLVRNKLNQMIAEKMAAVLQADGPLTVEALREKCTSVARLSDELLRGHLDYAVDKGLIMEAAVDDVLYFSAAK